MVFLNIVENDLASDTDYDGDAIPMVSAAQSQAVSSVTKTT